jgi:hypothetical protein
MRQIERMVDEGTSHARKRLWGAIAAAAAVAALAFFIGFRHWRPAWTTIQGAVIRKDSDPRRELPIANVLVTATRGTTNLSAQSDASGYFKIAFPGVIWPGQVVNLTFQRPDYEPQTIQMLVRFRSTTRQLVIAELTPTSVDSSTQAAGAPVVVNNIRVRYSVNTQSEENIGSAARTFQVANRGDVPCRRQAPCSPDGLWKASMGSVDLDAGSGNEFRDVRASCIAGPCPFTRIDSSGLANGNRVITARAIDWSDTATFVVEAEVFHSGIVSNVRQTYPVVFGRALHFTVPPTQEGVSLEAELNGVPMVFPLGPDLYLSWANCSARPTSESQAAMTYQCELKPGYDF